MTAAKPRGRVLDQLHPPSIWLVILQKKHKTEPDTLVLHHHLYTDRATAVEVVKKRKQHVVWFGLYSLTRQIDFKGATNGTRR